LQDLLGDAGATVSRVDVAALELCVFARQLDAGR
jgi:hypothetical protein